MKTSWDYSSLAKAYLKRPKYASKGLEKMYRIMNLEKEEKICDIGAGTGILTLELSKHGYQVTAIEPNDNMRENGINYTKQYSNVNWFEGSAEKTNQKSDFYDAVTFGSSFNVCDKKTALLESKRITKSNGWFACMWNHRDLKDPLQQEIEKIIMHNISDYSYGDRRKDQTDILKNSKLFSSVTPIQEIVIHKQSIEDCIEAWQSHATLHRQAKDKFNHIISEIKKTLVSLHSEIIAIPYITKIWVAQFI